MNAFILIYSSVVALTIGNSASKAQLSVATREELPTRVVHLRCVCELLTVENKCSSLLIEGLLARAALILKDCCPVHNSMHRVPITINGVPVGIDVALVIVGVIAVTVDDDFDVRHLLLNLRDVLSEGFKRDEHVSRRIDRLIVGLLIENVFICIERFHCWGELWNKFCLALRHAVNSCLDLNCLGAQGKNGCQNREILRDRLDEHSKL